MNCPSCTSPATKEQSKKTTLGYRTFHCSVCRRSFNERTGTAFNYLEYPTDLVLLVVFWRLRYKLSLRDLAEMFLQRGFVFTHETERRMGSALCSTHGRPTASPRGGDKGENPGMWMKRMSASKGNGVISIVPWIAMATWWTRGSSEKRDLEAAKRFDLRRLSTSPVMPQNG
jgi:putative transposase